MESGKRHDTTDTMDFYQRELVRPIQTGCGLVVYVADLLRTCYGETGVMDFSQYHAALPTVCMLTDGVTSDRSQC